MNCLACNVDNRAERRFCRECGSKLTPVICARCAFVNHPGESFCGGCGTAAVADAAPRLVPVAVDEAERRQLTVMFCDLVGSTALSAELDAEDLREVIVAFQDACAAQIARFDGYIARYMGDGMLIYFGYPRAREDSASRAVEAGLAIVEAVGRLSGLPIEPSVRVGIATGNVVVGDIIGEGASEERAVVGETPNLAARLQGLAEPGTVVISNRTRRLASLFEVEDLGRQSLKGFSEPVQAWRAVRLGRFELGTAAGGAEGPIVGREFEVALLADRWRQAAAGDGRVVVLTGEAGSGKTRLVSALVERIEDLTIKRFQCVPHRANTPLHPFIDAITRVAELDLLDSSAARADKLQKFMGRWPGAVENDFPSIAALLSIETDRPLQGGPDEQQQAIKETIFRALTRERAADLTLLLFEDVQWADPTTLELVRSLVARCASEPFMVIATHRPDFEPPWKRAGHITSLSVGKLATEHSRELVVALAGEVQLEPAVIDQIVDRGDGVPTFLTELTRAVLTSETGVVPETLHDSLAAQLDQVGDAREVAQVAAVIGREFSLSLLSRVYSGSEDNLRYGMQALISAGLVVSPGLSEGDNHSFRRTLLRDVAYGSLLKRSQRAFHNRIADVLINELTAFAQGDPEGVASHLCRAGRPREACGWWRRAAQRDSDRGAQQEAISHLQEAFNALADVQPDDAEGCALLVPLRIDLALALRLVSRFDEGFVHLESAVDLAMRHDLGADLSRAYFARGNLCFQTKRPQECQDSHQMALDVAQRVGDIEGEVRALGGLADASMLMGNFPAASVGFQRCIAMAEEHGFPRIAASNASVAAWTTMQSLDMDRAVELAVKAVDRASAVGNRRALRGAYNVCAQIFGLTGNIDEALRYIGLLDAVADPTLELFVVMGRGLVSRLSGDRESPAQAARELIESGESLGPTVVPMKSWLVATADAAHYDGLLDELEELYGRDNGTQVLLWSAVTLLEGLVYRGDWVNLRRFRALLEDALGETIAPLLTMWLEAADALADRAESPDSSKALAALEALHQRVSAIPLVLLARHIRDAIDRPAPLRKIGGV